jgi:hypothetical protein
MDGRDVFETAKPLFFIALLFAAPAFADISVGYLSILADSPTGGEQALQIDNMTGQATARPSASHMRPAQMWISRTGR